MKDFKNLLHTCLDSEIAGLLGEAEVVVAADPSLLSYALDHWFREGNRRYFLAFGTLYYPNCDSGFRPNSI